MVDTDPSTGRRQASPDREPAGRDSVRDSARPDTAAEQARTRLSQESTGMQPSAARTSTSAEASLPNFRVVYTGMEASQVPSSPFERFGLTPPNRIVEMEEKSKAIQEAFAKNRETGVNTAAILVDEQIKKGDVEGVRRLLQQTAEAGGDGVLFSGPLKPMRDWLANERKYNEINEIPQGSPLHLLADAKNQLRNSDPRAAEESYKAAIAAADGANRNEIRSHVKLSEQEQKEMANNPYSVLDTARRAEAWRTMEKAPELARMEYANFLMSEGRHDEAKAQLATIKGEAPGGDPSFAQRPDFRTTDQHASTDGPQDVVGPLRRLSRMTNEGDKAGAERAFAQAQNAAHELERDPAKMAALRTERENLDKKIKTDGLTPERAQRLSELEILQYPSSYVKIAHASYLQSIREYDKAETVIKNLDPQFDKDHPKLKDALLAECKNRNDLRSISKEFGKELLPAVAAYCIGGPWGIAAGIASYAAAKYIDGDMNRQTFAPIMLKGAINSLGGIASIWAGAGATAGIQMARNVGVAFAWPALTRFGMDRYSYLTGGADHQQSFRQAVMNSAQGAGYDGGANPLNTYPVTKVDGSIVRDPKGIAFVGVQIAKDYYLSRHDESKDPLRPMRQGGLIPRR